MIWHDMTRHDLNPNLWRRRKKKDKDTPAKEVILVINVVNITMSIESSS